MKIDNMDNDLVKEKRHQVFGKRRLDALWAKWETAHDRWVISHNDDDRDVMWKLQDDIEKLHDDLVRVTAWLDSPE